MVVVEEEVPLEVAGEGAVDKAEAGYVVVSRVICGTHFLHTF